MDIDRIRYFLSVCETKNLRKSADILGMTPGSLSKAIGVLSEEAGFDLLRAEGRGIEITEKGLRLAAIARPQLQRHLEFLASVRLLAEEKSEIQSVRFGCFEVFSTLFLSQLFDDSPMKYRVLELIPHKLELALLDDVIDLGLTYLASPKQGLEFREVGNMSFGIFGHKSWTKQNFEEWPFAIPTTAVRIESNEILALDSWPTSAPFRNVRFEFEMLQTALETAARGACVLHCPIFVARLFNENLLPEKRLSQLPFPHGYKKPVATKIFLVARKGSELLDAYEGRVAKLLRKLS